MSNPIILHVNAVEQGQTPIEMCRRAVEWGYEGIEFRRRGDNQESPEAYLDSLAAAVDETGLSHVLFGGPGPNLMGADPAVRRGEIDDCIAFYRLAADRFHLTVCNTMTGSLVAPGADYVEYHKNGSACATDEQWAWAVEGFQELGGLAVELGFCFAFETHNCYLHDLPAAAKELVERIDSPAVGVNFDFGNILLHPEGPSLKDSFELLRPYLRHVHLKNTYLAGVGEQVQRISCPLADGVINNRELLRRLFDMGYTGPIVVETPREGDREWFAQQDLTYLNAVLKNLA